MKFFDVSFYRYICVVLLLFFFSSVNYAQQQTSLQITVFDQNSLLIQLFEVELKDNQNKIIKKVINSNAKPVIFTSVKEGTYNLEIASPGFKSFAQEIYIKEGENSLKIKLEIEEIKVDVEVASDERERRLSEAFGGKLSKEQIESLPEEPDAIERELKQRYGEDAVIRVDGFTGGQLPPKSQISSIKVSIGSFDAEYHEAGTTVIDIATLAGFGKLFGYVRASFNDESLNARNIFANERLSEQTKNVFFILSGPLVKNKTSFTFIFAYLDNFKTNNFVGIAPIQNGRDAPRIGIKVIYPNISIKHNLTKNHLLYVNYSLRKSEVSNIGIGPFDFPERGSDFTSNVHTFRVSESGPFKKIFANEFRFEYVDEQKRRIPFSSEASIIVLNTFNKGGSNFNNSSFEKKLSFADNLLFDYKKHSFKLGGEIQFRNNKLLSADNLNGKFIFSNLADFENNKPRQFSQKQNSSVAETTQLQAGLYFQDNIRLTRSFQLGLGLRYEWQSDVNDNNNFSPRISFAWSPEKSGKFILRGGIGLFYNWFDANDLTTILSNDGRQSSELIILNPGYPNVFNGGIISQPLPPSILIKDSELQSPSVFVAQGGFNYRPNNKFFLEAIYTYKRGTNQFRSRDINAPINGVRPIENFGRISQVESGGNLIDNSLSVRFGATIKKVYINTNYTLSKNLTDFEGVFGLPSDSYNTNLDWAVSNLDQRHRLNATVTFRAIKKINVNIGFNLNSPLPYTVTTGRDDNEDTVFNDRPEGVDRNSLRGDWFNQTDLRLSRNFKLFGNKEKAQKSYTMGTEVSILNVFNQVNLQNFVGVQTSPYFRQPSSAASGRNIQFALYLSF